MTRDDAVLKALEMEELRWRSLNYRELECHLGQRSCYDVKQWDFTFLFEVDVKRSKNSNEIIVIVECSKKSWQRIHIGRSRFFARSESDEIREIDGDEAY